MQKIKLTTKEVIEKVNDILLLLRDGGYSLTSCFLIAEILKQSLKINIQVVEIEFKKENKGYPFRIKSEILFKKIEGEATRLVKDLKYKESSQKQIKDHVKKVNGATNLSYVN